MRYSFLYIIIGLFFVPSTTLSLKGQSVKINDVTISSTGQINWTTTNEKVGTEFEIMELKFGKWDSIGNIHGKGIGSNQYSFQTDTSCAIYEFKIKATDIKEHYSKVLKKTIIVIEQKGDFLYFSSKAPYVIFDEFGNKKLEGFCAISVDISSLKHGSYYLNVGPLMTLFKK